MMDGFERYVDDLAFGDVDGDVSDTTVQKRRTDLSAFSDWLAAERDVHNCEDVSNRDIRRYIEHLNDEGYAESTIKSGIYTSISAALTHLFREGVIEQNPARKTSASDVGTIIKNSLTTREKKRRAESGAKDHLTKGQVYELAEDHVPNPTDRNELLVKLLFWTGLRISEALQIEIGTDGRLDGPESDIDPETPKIDIYREKTDEAGVVSYPSAELNPLLVDWCRNGRLRYKCAESERALFIGRKGRLTKSRAVKIVKDAAESMGIQDIKTEAKDGRQYHRVTPHLLRHSHAMYQLNIENVPIDAIKDHLGHANVETTENFYAEGTEERIVDTFGE